MHVVSKHKAEFNARAASLDAPAYQPEIWNDLPIDPKQNVGKFFDKLREQQMGTFTMLQASSLLSLGGIASLCTQNDGYYNPTKSRIQNLLPPEEIEGIVSLAQEHFGHQQTRANCYAYAIDFRDGPAGAKPDPGGKTAEFKARLYDNYATAITEGAIEDGLIHAGTDLPPVKDNFYRAALLVDHKTPSFHWVREDLPKTEAIETQRLELDPQSLTLSWSSKDGHGPVKNTDYRGQIITDPREASFGNYEFHGFFYVQKGGIIPGSMNADL